MNLVEIDFIVEDSAKFFELYGTRSHMLDTNPDYGMITPSKDNTNLIWSNMI